MPRKFKLSYKKHASVKKETHDVESINSIDNSTQTDFNVVEFDSASTQTEVITTSDTGVQTVEDQSAEQLHLLSPMPFTFVVKLKLDLYFSLAITEFDQLYRRLNCLKSINDWFLLPMTLQSEKLQIVKLSQQQNKSSFIVEVLKDLTWSLKLPSGCLSHNNSPVLLHLPQEIRSLQDIMSVLAFLDQSTVCKGNSDPMFAPIVAQHKGVFKDRTGSKINAYFDQQFLTIRHVSCHWLLPDSTKLRCQICIQYRENFLRGKLRSSLDQPKQGASDPSSHVNYRYLDTPTRLERMKNLHSLVRKQTRQIKSLEERLNQSMKAAGIRVNESTHDELSMLMNKYSKDVTEKNSEDSFQSIFWMQQLKALSAKKKTQIRWHPLIIRWALYLHYKSHGAYEALRKSGVINLPTTRTLRDYRHFSSHCQAGFSAIADQQLLKLIKQRKPNHLAKYVILLVDEMYLKEGLVYEKSTGALVGFTDLGGVTQKLLEYEQMLSGNGTQLRQLAKTMMVIMVRGVFTDIHFPYAQFPMASPKGSDIFPLIWRAIDRLECNDLKVIGVTCDGASVNRRFLKLHGNSLTYKTNNIYSDDNRSVFFFIDPPHLLKTIRNALYNPSRHLWCNDQPIKWQFIREVYEQNLGSSSNVGISMVQKLTLEHLNLTSFSKMRVDLAAQVMSSTVSNALFFTRRCEVFETAHFIEKVDKFFDCLNVSNFTQGKHTRKPYQEPYRDSNDFRIKFLKEFLQFFKTWKSSVDKRMGYNKKEKMMILPEETTSGIHITVSAFIELIQYLFKIPGVTGFLSNKINQDPLEKFFGIQRQTGRSNENPTVAQFIKNTDTIRVINSIWIDDITGNCRGQNSKKYTDFEAAKLPLCKRKRRMSF